MKTGTINVGEFNYAQVTLTVRDTLSLRGAPDVTLVARAEASMDGQNWVTIPDLGARVSTVGVSSTEGYVRYPRLRFDVRLSPTPGSAADLKGVVFDLQTNLVSK
jgi:hypothetical protein